MPSSPRAAKIDSLCEAAVEFAREVALEVAGVMGVGDHIGCRAEGERVASHLFACPHPGYRGWQWSGDRCASVAGQDGHRQRGRLAARPGRVAAGILAAVDRSDSTGRRHARVMMPSPRRTRVSSPVTPVASWPVP